MTTINFNVVPPPPALKRDVECVRISTYSGDRPLEVKVCPSGYPGIVFQLAADRGAAIESIAIRTAQTSQIPILTPEQFNAEELERPLLTANSTDERVLRINQFLINQVKRTNQRDELIESALDYIRDHIVSITVQDLIAAFHISERQFQKRFNRVVGMPPQLFIRVRRINEALRFMHSGQYERLSDVAYALNYYDQSHFIRDMKSFSWVSPKHIAMKVSEFHNDLAGSSYL